MSSTVYPNRGHNNFYQVAFGKIKLRAALLSTEKNNPEVVADGREAERAMQVLADLVDGPLVHIGLGVRVHLGGLGL